MEKTIIPLTKDFALEANNSKRISNICREFLDKVVKDNVGAIKILRDLNVQDRAACFIFKGTGDSGLLSHCVVPFMSKSQGTLREDYFACFDDFEFSNKGALINKYDIISKVCTRSTGNVSNTLSLVELAAGFFDLKTISCLQKYGASIKESAYINSGIALNYRFKEDNDILFDFLLDRDYSFSKKINGEDFFHVLRSVVPESSILEDRLFNKVLTRDLIKNNQAGIVENTADSSLVRRRSI